MHEQCGQLEQPRDAERGHEERYRSARGRVVTGQRVFEHGLGDNGGRRGSKRSLARRRNEPGFERNPALQDRSSAVATGERCP